MKAEIELLEQRVEQLLDLVHSLDAANRDLKLRVSTLEADKTRMLEKMQAAAARIADVMERLPHEL
jgi:chromosome segregation ATPase